MELLVLRSVRTAIARQDDGKDPKGRFVGGSSHNSRKKGAPNGGALSF